MSDWMFKPKDASEIVLVAEHRTRWWKKGGSRKTKTVKHKSVDGLKTLGTTIENAVISKTVLPPLAATPPTEENDTFPYKGIFGG